MAARELASDFLKTEVEKIIDVERLAEVVDEAHILASQIQSAAITYELAVKLLGGLPPAKKGTSKHGQGYWGCTSEAKYKVDVPTTFQHLGRIMAKFWGEGLGCETEEAELGMVTMARTVVSSLSAANAKLFFDSYFKKLEMAGIMLRTRCMGSQPLGGQRPPHLISSHLISSRLIPSHLTTSPSHPTHPSGLISAHPISAVHRSGAPLPDFDRIRLEVTDKSLDPIVAQQDSEGHAERVAMETVDKAIAANNLMQAGAKHKLEKVKATPADPAAAKAKGKGPPQPKGAAKATTPVTFAAAAGGGAKAPATLKAPPAPTALVSTRLPAPGEWVPDWTPDSIGRKVILKGEPKTGSAVDAFDFVCRQQGLAHAMPCAFQELFTQGCNGPPNCKKCAAQLKLATPTPVPAGLVAKVKAACKDDLADLIR